MYLLRTQNFMWLLAKTLNKEILGKKKEHTILVQLMAKLKEEHLIMRIWFQSSRSSYIVF